MLTKWLFRFFLKCLINHFFSICVYIYTYTHTFISSITFTETHDIADAVIFLLSDYSKMVNGLNLYVDGGLMSGWTFYIYIVLKTY